MSCFYHCYVIYIKYPSNASRTRDVWGVKLGVGVWVWGCECGCGYMLVLSVCAALISTEILYWCRSLIDSIGQKHDIHMLIVKIF